MNNTPTINNASVSLPLGEIEPLIPRREISFRQIANCLCLPETRAASTGIIFLTAGALIFGFGSASLKKVSIPLMAVGGLALLWESILAVIRGYQRESPFASSPDLELQSHSNLDPEQTSFQSNAFTSTAPPPYTEQSIPPPTYEESCNFPCTPPPEYEENCTLSEPINAFNSRKMHLRLQAI